MVFELDDLTMRRIVFGHLLTILADVKACRTMRTPQPDSVDGADMNVAKGLFSSTEFSIHDVHGWKAHTDRCVTHFR